MNSNDQPRSIVVVGASLAGLRTAAALRRNGFEGSLTIVGAEDHWPPYDRPPLSKHVLVGAIEPERARIRVPDDLDLEVITGCRATGVDVGGRTVALDDHDDLSFDRLVIATGAAPRHLPGTQDIDAVHTLRTIDDSLRLRERLQASQRVAVIGAGFIGCEVASACLEMDLDVSLVDIEPVPLVPLGRTMGTFVRGVQAERGVDLHLGTGVTAIDSTSTGADVRLDDGTTLSVDTVVVGIGVIPSTAWLAGSGLQVDDGVVCDESCLALGGDGLIAAVGDVARWIHPRYGSLRVEHWTNASEQATHVANALLSPTGEAGPFAPVPYFWSDQFGLKLQYVGAAGPDADVAIAQGSEDERSFVATYTENGEVTAALCVNAPREMATWTRTIGEGVSA
ncbi:MAG: FAD/NAD(P)-binding oxidoreductase [Acidimicrobiales bacterium]|nr:FAD/NAD(P)-binding oxidoreductase [Acidimicrobiales bacterium]